MSDFDESLTRYLLEDDQRPVLPVSVLRQRKRARDYRRLATSAAALAAVVVAGGLVQQAQGRDSLTTEFATEPDEDADAAVTFTVQPVEDDVSAASQVALQACLDLPGVTPSGPVTFRRVGGATAIVAGEENIRGFDACVRPLAGYEVIRSDYAAADVAAARARWDAAGISDYSYTLRHECFCPPAEFRVTVTGGQAVGIERTVGDDPRTPDQFRRSVDDLLDFVQTPPTDIAALQAVFDERYGFPRRIDVDAKANAIDDEYAYEIRDFQPVRPSRSAPSTPATPTASPATEDMKDACRHIQLAMNADRGASSQGQRDWDTIEAELHAAWRAGRDGSNETFVRRLVEPGAVAEGDTQTLGDALFSLAVMCGIPVPGPYD